MSGNGKEIAWLARLARQILANASVRPKIARVIDSRILLDIRLHLTKLAGPQPGATRDSAVQYRDGLMIMMLAARPLRLSELLAMRLGNTIRREGRRYVVSLRSAKSRRTLEPWYPTVLTPLIDVYVDKVRPKLAGTLKSCGADVNDFWLSRRGRAMMPNNVTHRISNLTRLHLQRDLSPHLFRHSAATSIAIKDPGHVGIVKDVLGHTSWRTGEQHYNLAAALPAVRRFQDAVLATRVGLPRRVIKPNGKS
jgi:integrase/recombinase XerD